MVKAGLTNPLKLYATARVSQQRRMVFSGVLCGGYPMTLTILDPLTGKMVTITVPSGKTR